ncbi:ribonuclease p/mrp protein subunit pop5 [Anaeramoeba flamelloides]|uniref:Ribonuclease P/MRP protein subunit POP5 n=1 Tax=Anaeramoeba flamelloides TaxID=1746091 RepID=A0ABQ8XDI7_9EUKA|nr:ribonuclease p/mrp protein subunit pop5 [Anaeramoeba flamelloides]
MVRVKFRYLLGHVRWQTTTKMNSLDISGIYHYLKNSVKLNFGEYAICRLGWTLNVKQYNPLTGLFIVRCSRSQMRQVWLSLTLLDEINSQKCAISIIHSAGTIRSCNLQAIKHTNSSLLVAKSLIQIKNEKEKYQKKKNKKKKNKKKKNKYLPNTQVKKNKSKK